MNILVNGTGFRIGPDAVSVLEWMWDLHLYRCNTSGLLQLQREKKACALTGSLIVDGRANEGWRRSFNKDVNLCCPAGRQALSFLSAR